jgi:hypothetical protein
MEKWMKQGLEAGKIYDLSKCHRTEGGDYIVEDYKDGKDYWDVLARRRAIMIARHKTTGQVVAFTSLQNLNDEYEKPVLWMA